MSDLPIGLMLDGLLAVLLVATIGYCLVLNRRLDNLRLAGEQMKVLVGSFTAATEQAKASVTALRQAAEVEGASLQEHIDRARVLRDELSFLAETGDALADRLAGARKVRTPSAGTPPGSGPLEVSEEDLEGLSPEEKAEVSAALEIARAASEGSSGPDSEAERQLLQALRQAR